MKIIVRGFGLLLWLTAVGLTIALVIEFAAEGSNGVALGIAGLAIAISAIGLAFARYAWQRRAYPEIALGIAMWLAGFVCLAFIEVSYWVSSYEERFAQYNEQKTAKQRHEAKSEKDWKALLTGEVPATAAQIEAEIKGKRLDAAVTRSANCTNVTREDSRRVCQELAALEAKLAAALKREQMETSVVTSIGAKVASSHIANNVFAFAEVMAELRGGTVKDWSYVIMLWNWILLTLVRDAGALVANPLGRRRDAATLPQEPRKADPVQDALQAQVEALTRVAETLKAAEKAMPQPRTPLPATLGKITGAKYHEALAEASLRYGAGVPPITDISEKLAIANIAVPSPSEKNNNSPSDGGGGTPLPSPSPVENSDTQDDLVTEEVVEIKAENVYTFPVTKIEEVTKPSRLSRPQDFKKKPEKVTKNDRDALILAWAECCGTRLPKTDKPDTGAPLATDAWRESYVPWAKMHTYPIASKQRFSQIMAQELDLGHSKEKGSKRSKKGRKLDGFRYQTPSEMPIQKRARA